MNLLGIDLGGTKLALAILTDEGKILNRQTILLGDRKGKEVGLLITESIGYLSDIAEANGTRIDSVGISVPGISRNERGNVWAPNILGWDDYPLLKEIREVCGEIPVIVDSDRACSVSGEFWKGNARDCRNVIFITVGTGIGAGILVDGEVLRGEHDIAGAIGWMALGRPFDDKYAGCGCFEYFSSGEGIARLAKEFLKNRKTCSGELEKKWEGNISSHDVFTAFQNNDPLATEVIRQCIEYWGMAAANLVSLFNPEKIIFGGGVFGPAIPLIPEISKEARKWAQPVSMNQVTIEASALGEDAVIYGAVYLALKQMLSK
jgi:glucokinase